MEKFLLAPFLSREELHVVYEQNVRIAVPLAEVGDVSVAQGGDVFVHEVFGGDVGYRRGSIVFEYEMGDGVHEVRLAEAGRAVDEERVEGDSDVLGDGEGRGVRKSVAFAYYETLEGIARVY